MDFEEKQRKMAMGLEALARLKKMKGQEMPGSLQGIRENLKEKGIEPNEAEKDKLEKMNRGLDMLEAMKRGKAAEKEEEKNKIKCSKCGRKVPEGNFCVYCGNSLEKKENEPDADKEIKINPEKQKSQTSELTPELKNNLELMAEARNIVSREDMIKFLDELPNDVRGSRESFEPKKLKKIITEVLDSRDENQLNRVTRTGGLRDKVNEIMIRERLNKKDVHE